MKFLASISNATQQYHAELEVADDDDGRARVAAALHDIQEQFVPRGAQPKKAAPRPAASSARPTPHSAGEGSRDK